MEAHFIISTLLFTAILFLSFLVGAVAAYGSNLLALPLMLFIIQDVDTVVAVLLISGTVQTGHLALLNRSFLDTRKLLVILGLCLAGTPIGFCGSAVLPERELMLFVELVFIISGVIHPLWAVILKLPRVVCAALLVLGGTIHGAFGPAADQCFWL